MNILINTGARVAVSVISDPFWHLGNHHEAAIVAWLNDHGHVDPNYAMRLEARSQPPEVLPPAPPSTLCCVYFQRTFENFKLTES